MGTNNVRDEVLRLSSQIRQRLNGIEAHPGELGAALMETGLQLATAGERRDASAAERKLIRSHFPGATDANIAEHRLSPEGMRFTMSFLITLIRKYLDHQPETSAALDACQDDAKVDAFATVVARNMMNAYAGTAGGLSSYDVAATLITNASIAATAHGVPLEQVATIHLEAIQRALEALGERG